MATTYNPQTDLLQKERTVHSTKLSLWAVPIGRAFYSLIFIISGITHFSSGTIQYAASAGVPFADILVPISGVMSLIGGLSVFLGFHARMGATFLLLFLVPVTLIMHDFWSITDPQAAQAEMANFLKNISMIGGSIFLIFYGAGPKSIDHHQAKRRTKAL